jgi:Holliday junction resolvase RusA-like endonuclease
MVQKVPISIKLKFVFEIPKSRKELKVGMPHLQKPDIDNCEKGITDSLTGIVYKDDCVIWKVKQMVKVWGLTPLAEVTVETN